MNPAAIDSEFQSEIEMLIGRDASVVVAHAGLWSFAHTFARDARTIPLHVLRLMCEVVGPRRTLVIPAYSFSFCASRTYDLVRTPAETGVLSVAAVDASFGVRTRQPIYSNVVIGPRAEQVVSLEAKTAWGSGSAMEWFGLVNARYLLLGIPWHLSASIIHSSEERARVPYRYLKVFTGRLLRDGVEVGPVVETLYVRSRMVPPDLDYAPATEHIRSSADYACSRLERWPLEAASTRSICAAADRLLRADAFAFVRNRREVEDWIREGRAGEVATLAADERVPSGAA